MHLDVVDKTLIQLYAHVLIMIKDVRCHLFQTIFMSNTTLGQATVTKSLGDVKLILVFYELNLTY